MSSLLMGNVNSNRLKPGDNGFDYDVRVDFQDFHEDNEWDDDSGSVSIVDI